MATDNVHLAKNQINQNMAAAEAEEEVAMELPEEIMMNILVRLSVKSLVRFRCVCKSWRSLINNPYYIRKHHLNYTTNVYNEYESVVIHVSSPTTFKHMEINKHEKKEEEEEEEDEGDSKKIRFSLKELDCPSELSCGPCLIRGSCDGILFIVDRDSIFLWNPSIKVYIKLPNKFHCKDVFGMGYDPTVDDYKVFRAPRHLSNDMTNAHPSVEVLALKSNYWKKVQDDFPYTTITGSNQYPIFTNGRIHWVATHDDVTREALILYFDVVEEKLGEVPLPLQGSFARESLQLLKGDLCVAQCKTESLFEFWVMKEYGVRESWIKLMTVPKFPEFLFTPSARASPFCLTRTGVVLFIKGTGEFVMYNTKDESFEKIFISGLGSLFWKISYVESLVSPSPYWLQGTVVKEE